jgi:Carbohydrate esterase, sialic acid-specific acetylesterase
MNTTHFSMFMLSMALYGAIFQIQAINLGGTNVPKDHFIVYLGIGHCNFAGRNITSADAVTDPHAWNYAWDSQGKNDSQWVLAQEHNGGDANGMTAIGYSGLTQRGTGGPSMPFLKGMVQQHPGYYFGMITNALSSAMVRLALPSGVSGVPPSDIDTYSKSGGGNRYKEIIGLAQKVKNDVTFGGILCMLGMTEVATGTLAGVSTIKSDFVQLATDIRTDLGLPNLPFLVGHYEMGATGNELPTTQIGVIVVKAIDSLPNAISFCDTVSDPYGSQYYIGDHHYNTLGESIWAANAVACIAKHGWFPTTSAINSPENNAGRELQADVSVTPRNARNFSVVASFSKSILNPALMLFNAKGEAVKGQSFRTGNQIRYEVGGCGNGLYIARVSGNGMVAFKQVMLVL